jgi:hypothetical protein
MRQACGGKMRLDNKLYEIGGLFCTKAYCSKLSTCLQSVGVVSSAYKLVAVKVCLETVTHTVAW